MRVCCHYFAAYPQASRLGACGFSGNGPIMAGAPLDPPHDRKSILRMFEQDLGPFVAKFAVAWPLDFTGHSVRAAMSQCTTLEEFAATLPDEDGDKKRIQAWLFPSFNSRGPMVMRCYWGCISPLNLLNFVLLAGRSRFAGMAAWAMVPFLCDPSRPHASASDVLQAWNLVVGRHGRFHWQQLVNVLSLYMPPRGLSIESLVTGIVHHRDIYHDESMLICCFLRDFQSVGPPSRPPYALEA